MLRREVLSELPPHVLPLPCNVSQRDVTVNLTNLLLIWQSEVKTMAHPSARVYQGELRRILWTQT